jgi:enoyl-CoA hydratase/carnithine racemase
VPVEIEWEEDRRVARITLAWPERRNALGPAEARELVAALEEVGEGRCVVLAAEGPVFCAGGDLDAISRLAERGREAVRDEIYNAYHGVARALWGLHGVTFAAVDGGAVGLGADLAFMCAMRFVGPEGWIDQGWARLGLIAGTGGAWMVAAVAGLGTAWDFVTSSGTRWDSARLQAAGLAVAAPESALSDALERAARVALWPPDAISAYRELLRPEPEGYQQHLSRCLEHQSDLITSEAFRRLADGILRPDSSPVQD